MSRPVLGLAAVLVLGFAGAAAAQEGADDIGTRLLADPAIRAALDRAQANEPEILKEQARLCEIPAPTFHEERRAAALRTLFESLGLRDVRVDEAGNVLGERPGRRARPHVVVAAHLDTVFPEETALAVTSDGPRLKGPGIGDNCRGLAALIGIVRALREASVETEGSLTFAANTGEEGLGNSKGIQYLFDVGMKGAIDRFVSIDGSGIGYTHVGVGAHRYRVTFKGPGGHSYYAFGNANPIHALGRAIAGIAALAVPADPRTTFNVGRIGGGTSINSIASEAWMDVDMRSHDAASLDGVDARIHEAVASAVRDENARWGGKGAVSASWERVGLRLPGMTAAEAPIIQATASVTRALGLAVKTFPGTTDSNVPMAIGVPAVTIDGGGSGSGGHSPGEVFDSTESWKGTQRALLLAVALTRP
jgi:tripeptide aminopeptidase